MRHEEENKKLKYILYARRSIGANKNEEDNGVPSIESQKTEVRAIAKNEGLTVVQEFNETVSASEPDKRPEFTKMMEYIKSGKANAILCFKVDRLARNSIDAGTITHYLQKSVIKNIRSIDRDWYPDDHALLWAVEFGTSTQYTRDLKKHIKRGQNQSIARGFRPGNAPLGYKNSKYRDKGKNEEILIDTERFLLVRKVFEHMLTGQYNVHQILKFANDELRLTTRKGNKMCKTNMYALLINPFYYGWFRYPQKTGELTHGKHTPMITKQEFDKIQYFLGRAGQTRPHDHNFAYTGLMKCGECGARITCEQKTKRQKNGNTHSYIYYHCTGRVNPNCTQKSIKEEVLEKQIEHFLSSIEISPEFHTWAIEELKTQHEAEKNDRNKILYTQQRDYDQCIKKLDSLTEMRINKEIDGEEFAARKTVLEEEKHILKSLLDGVDKRVDDWLKSVAQTLTFAEKAHAEFNSGDLYKRKQILTALGHNHILKDNILIIETEKPLLLIPEVATQYKLSNEQLEPVKCIGTYKQNVEILPKSTLLWTLADSNR
ncbi:MAG: hypothetical protein JWP09_434 [Candidatus Taylorbacteria bacterium]|nr:hypothetical protein [Candidatus Taylorbacteria bacterium]